MGQISNRLQSVKARLSGSRSPQRDEDAAARALRKQAAKAERIEQKRAADRNPNTWRP